MLDYQSLQFRFLIIYGNSPRKKSMFTFLFWFFTIFHYATPRIFNNCSEWGRSKTMLFLGGHVNIRRFFVPCNESFQFLDNFNFFDTCRLRKISQKKGLTLFYMYFGPPWKYHAFTWFRLRCRSQFSPCWLHGPHVK